MLDTKNMTDEELVGFVSPIQVNPPCPAEREALRELARRRTRAQNATSSALDAYNQDFKDLVYNIVFPTLGIMAVSEVLLTLHVFFPTLIPALPHG